MSLAQAFFRTSRAALRQQNGVNPVQSALGSRGGVQFTAATRNYATVFERNKPHVNIGTIGHVDHGKQSRSVRPRRASPGSSNMAPSIRRPKSGNVVSRSRRRISSTRPRLATTLTSTARVTQITSRT
ncbi:hypothetical protein LTR28_001193 [Elasticomyces elasticus]|nr:hypothetical protein LTR28_001193 [Elasticomyces elasticus]